MSGVSEGVVRVEPDDSDRVFPLTVGAFGAEATAYLPAFIAPFVSTTAVGMTVAMLVALSSSFLLTLAVNVLHLRKAEPATT